VRLPDGLAAGDLLVSINAGGEVSNKALIRIKPSGAP